ncbi:hypothetical protein [Spirillospora sp. CA-294931]|uniref:hypothetical protein n=1 Tax=Spirillospora sp. CA-294931 TaxID=3240042 RepID=UPI003D9073BE
MVGRHRRPRGVRLEDEAGWFRDQVIPDLLDDGQLQSENLSRLQHAAVSLAHGLAVAVVLAVAPAVWSELHGSDGVDLAVLWETAKVAAISAIVSYFRPRR